MEYILDVAKWRCGSQGPFMLGEGRTLMLNEEGYMCCLGQFAAQKGVGLDRLLDKGSPAYLKSMYDESFCIVPYGYHPDDTFNTDLAASLMSVNDNDTTTPEEKIQIIRKKLEEHGHTLKVINEDLL